MLKSLAISQISITLKYVVIIYVSGVYNPYEEINLTIQLGQGRMILSELWLYVMLC